MKTFPEAPRGSAAHVYEGQWALITGASSGIGESFAKALASRGCNVVLTARRSGELDIIADRIMNDFNVKTLVITADLGREDGLDGILNTLAERDCRIDVLVCSAGYAMRGRYGDNEWTDYRRYLEANVLSPARLVRALLPNMQSNNRGLIIQVASIAGLIPGFADFALYSAVKAFQISLAETLAADYSSRGIKVIAICPGSVDTEFHDIAGTRQLIDKQWKLNKLTPDQVAKYALDSAGRPGTVVIPGLMNRLFVFFTRIIPRNIAFRMINRLGK
jgi:short-subunit dehydrogenase